MVNITQFIRENREMIDQLIKDKNPNQSIWTDSERRLWILNDEGMYHLAKSMGATGI